MENEEDQKR